MSRSRLILLLLVLVTLVVYLPVLHFDFINFDDQVYVYENSFVQAGWTWEGVKWAFTTWYGSNWHPLTWLSHMTDCELFGLNPGAHHFVNVLFHAANTAVLFLFSRRLLKSYWSAGLVAALFAWHPLHLESVAWIAERKDVLSTFFALLALLAYTRYVQEGHRPSFWWALVCFALGLLAKPMLVTLPFVLLLLDWWPLGRVTFNAPLDGQAVFKVAVEKWPFFVLTAVSCVVTYLAQKAGAAVMTFDQMSTQYRLEDAVIAYGLYLYKMVWPVRLAILYPLPIHAHWINAMAATSGAVLILISWLAWRWRRTAPYFLFGWAWFIGMMVPVIGLIKVGSALLADRYTYLSMVGLTLALAAALQQLVTARPGWLKPVAGLAAAALVGCVALTDWQLPNWRNSETMFERTLEVTSDNVNAEINYAVALDARGDTTNALVHCENAARISPDNAMAHLNLGDFLLKLNQPEKALPELQKAVELDPTKPSFRNTLGLGLIALNRLDDALAQFEKASRSDPNYSWSRFEAGDVLLKLGRDSEAIDHFREAVRLDPDNYQILTHVAEVLAASDNSAIRDPRHALILAQKANYITGEVQPYIMDVVGMAYAANTNFDEALTNAHAAFDLANAAHLKGLTDLQKRLELYQQHQPWVESFRGTNAAAAKP